MNSLWHPDVSEAFYEDMMEPEKPALKKQQPTNAPTDIESPQQSTADNKDSRATNRESRENERKELRFKDVKTKN